MLYINKQKTMMCLRVATVFILPAILTFWIYSNLKIYHEFNPLLGKQDKYEVKIMPIGFINSLPVGLDINLLKYKAVVFNDLKVVIGGDTKDYEHEVEIFIKYDENQEKILTKYKEENVIFKNMTRKEIILAISKITFPANINLKPETLNDENKVLTINKEIKGKAFINITLTNFYVILIYISLLIFMSIIIQGAYAIRQFVVSGF